jgi:hypothetical protein
MSSDSGVWLAAILTIAAYSFLWKENRLYRAAEHIFVGIGAGYSLVMGYTNVVGKAWEPITGKGQIYLLIPVIMGLMLFARFAKSVNWASRIPLAFLVGMGAAVALRGAIEQQFVKQVQATMMPLNSLNNIIVVLGTIGVLSYFFFTFPKNRALSVSTDIGRWIMMVTFGAAFGNGVMGRISLSIGIMQFMFGDWIKLIK